MLVVGKSFKAGCYGMAPFGKYPHIIIWQMSSLTDSPGL